MRSDIEQFKHPHVTSDILLFGIVNGKLAIYLSKRQADPYLGSFTCQGSFIHEGETAEITAERVAREKIGTTSLYLEQLKTYTMPDRDPRGWVITIAYIGITAQPQSLPNNDLGAWFIIEETDTGIWLTNVANGSRLQIAQLKFMHDIMLADAIDRMRGKLEYTPIGLHFTNASTGVTIPELKAVYKAILGNAFNANNFARDVVKKQFLDKNILQATRQTGTLSGAGQPPIIYKYIK